MSSLIHKNLQKSLSLHSIYQRKKVKLIICKYWYFQTIYMRKAPAVCFFFFFTSSSTMFVFQIWENAMEKHCNRKYNEKANNERKALFHCIFFYSMIRTISRSNDLCLSLKTLYTNCADSSYNIIQYTENSLHLTQFSLFLSKENENGF